MARTFNTQSLEILKRVSQSPGISPKELFKTLGRKSPYKEFYNAIYRLKRLELLAERRAGGQSSLVLASDGEKLLRRTSPERDGLWKLVIFDIPEKQKYVRTVLRAKIKSLGFKKWQNSIWISPYQLDAEIEEELKELAKKFFVRLIKTTDINVTDDLEKLFN